MAKDKDKTQSMEVLRLVSTAKRE